MTSVVQESVSQGVKNDVDKTVLFVLCHCRLGCKGTRLEQVQEANSFHVKIAMTDQYLLIVYACVTAEGC